MRTDKKLVAKRDVQMARDCYDDCIAFLDEQLGRLLQELRGQGLLENTVVIITSDHGEAFGDHGYYGHLFSLHLDVTGVPLVILSPGAPAGEVVNGPVSLRDLPATVVELSGLKAKSPFPGRSLSGYWLPASGRKPEGSTSPAFSERADATTFQPQPASGHGYSGLLMSLVAEGHHYLRDGAEAETLYDLESDPFERHDLRGTPHGEQAVATFRRKLLEVLIENPGSLEAEAAYLERYRQGLKALVEERSRPRVAAGH
jgi:arylsulfatase A-like enzyme